MPYWQTFYHIVWATRNRAALVTPDVEAMIYGFIRGKAIGLGGTVFALNGMPEHIHLVTSIPPSIAVSTFIGQVKGVTATKFNRSGVRELPLFWQEEYGVFTFDHKSLPNLVVYVENQKKHHANQNVIPVLERLTDQGVNLVRESAAPYTSSDEQWWQDMLAMQ